ncbi:LOW QUALITY PROTEIN: F-box/LRR-repeat protein 18-like [Ursus maritimus]|uniref:LOW QUALITY PROTEIN: F-box/LRR-repeat protein 18-like n=1 Tax=Ursus maritimus TaxID=29073 RepID=A0A8M1GA08_URSMA|nr:LOW QUALITY PROTEIN: F-box/LRR-repeat protein 18-like [Ursus maritimus]
MAAARGTPAGERKCVRQAPEVAGGPAPYRGLCGAADAPALSIPGGPGGGPGAAAPAAAAPPAFDMASSGEGVLVPLLKGPLFLEAHMSDLASEASCNFVDFSFYRGCGDQGYAEGHSRDPIGIRCCPSFQDTSNDDDVPPAAAAVAVGAHLLGFSDEILLHILSHVPSTDLVLNVRRTCRKLAVLCLDKSLTHTVLLQKDYEASEDKVKQLVKEIGREIQQLQHGRLYWLSGATIEPRGPLPLGLVKVNLSGCHLTSLRLSKMLSALQHLRSLAIDVSPGFDAGQLSGECKATLSRVRELKQTLYTPSYGVVPCCTSLEKLLLYFEILDRTREGAILSGQLMVGQSNVPHYQNLRVFYARLAPGYINQEVVRLYLAVLSDRTPENLHAFLISVPGSFAESGATKNLLDSMARNVALDALQLPRSWLNGSSLLQHMKFNDPFYFSFSRCTLSGGHLIQRVINGGKELRSLASLNLSGCVHCLSPDSLLRKAEDDIDSGILETLVASCRNLRHLNLSAAHHHSSEGPGRHLCQLLARLRHLRSLSLPVCSVADSAPRADRAPAQPAMHAVPRGFGKKVRIGVQSCPNPFSGQAGPQPSSVFWSLLKSVPFLERLELIGSNFSSAMPRNEPAIRNSLPPCGRAQNVGDSEVAAIGQLAFLRHLTLAQLPSILTGSGLVSIGLQCQQLQSLSLANLGMMGKVVYMSALSDMLKHSRTR